MIRFHDVSFRYPSSVEGVADAVSEIDLSVDRGELVVVLGANGSGKSTIARLANGLLTPTVGQVVVDGMGTGDVSALPEIRRRVGIVLQNPDSGIVATSVEADAAFGPENLGLPREEIRRRVDLSLATFGLDGLEQREPHTLSGGQKQRLAIAGVFAMGPDYVVLDEPTSMLDPTGEREVIEAIRGLRDAGSGIVHITHDLSHIVGADRVVVMDAGHIVFSGSIAELVEKRDSFAEWGIAFPGILELGFELFEGGVDTPADLADPIALAEALWR